MPVYDFECRICGHVFEAIVPISECNRPLDCARCNAEARHIITMSGVHLGNEDAAGWIRSVLDVVDKDSKAPHVQNFIKDPTRRNYRAWMKGEGLRPLEPGERTKPPPVNMDRIGRKLWDRHRKRKRIEIG